MVLNLDEFRHWYLNTKSYSFCFPCQIIWMSPPPSYQIVQCLTGHGKLNSYLFKFKLIEPPLCSCEVQIETVDHFLLQCKTFHQAPISFKTAAIKYTKSWSPALHQILQINDLWHVFKKYYHWFAILYTSDFEEGGGKKLPMDVPPSSILGVYRCIQVYVQNTNNPYSAYIISVLKKIFVLLDPWRRNVNKMKQKVWNCYYLHNQSNTFTRVKLNKNGKNNNCNNKIKLYLLHWPYRVKLARSLRQNLVYCLSSYASIVGLV